MFHQFSYWALNEAGGMGLPLPDPREHHFESSLAKAQLQE